MLPSTSIVSILALAAGAVAKGVSITPHDKYSSSVGVLGCKIDTNRVAYWPGSVDCNNICVKLSYEGRSVHLLRIDQSGGAYDVSYDAWVYLQSGKSAKSNPLNGGGVNVEVEEVDASECASLIKTEDHKLPLSASNSINFLTSCLAQPNSWVAKNYALYNICDAICTLGFDESCKLDLDVSNQPSCKNTLGLTTKLSLSSPVVDIQYGTGKTVLAGTGGDGTVVDIPDTTNNSPASSSSSSSSSTSSSTSTSQAAPTRVAAPTTVVEQKPTTTAGGVFHEVPSSASSAEAATTVAAPASSQSAPATSAAPSSSAQVSSSVPSLTVSSSVIAPSSGLTNTSTPSTTLSSVTVSTPASTPSASSTTVPVSAGRRGVEMSLVALVSSVVACSLVGLF
ncbi:unnamed protein product [Clonostachys chloroleuca]|uniref:Uncharacterized protein n=1 Tax=Clonostachys chloroleuca TaxID=1926264 RepID=A0AA35QER2_9HYPO|nr:unnamed protein product [Clonostachys chloroleuca]